MKKEQTLRSDLGRKSVAQGTCRAGSARETPLPRPAQAACSGAAFRPVGAQPWEDTGFFRFAPSPPGPAAAPTGRLHAHAPSCFRPVGRSLDAGGAKANIFLSAPVGAPAGTSGTSHSQVADLRGARPKGHAAALPHQCNQCGRRNSLPASFWEELARSHFSSPSLRSLQTCLKLTPHFSCFSMSLDASTTP